MSTHEHTWKQIGPELWECQDPDCCVLRASDPKQIGCPHVRDDIKPHFNLSLGRRITSRAQLRETELALNVRPVETQGLTSKDPVERRAEAAEVVRNSDEKRYREMREIADKAPSLAEIDAQERRVEIHA